MNKHQRLVGAYFNVAEIKTAHSDCNFLIVRDDDYFRVAIESPVSS